MTIVARNKVATNIPALPAFSMGWSVCSIVGGLSQMGDQVIDKELEPLSDGALRVARRKALYSLQNMMEIHDRLNLDKNGDYSYDHSSANCQGSGAWAADHLASNIKSELDRRNAEYKPRHEVMD